LDYSEAPNTPAGRWLVAREIIIGFGFLSGLGAEPITVTSNAFEKFFVSYAPQYVWVFAVAPYLLSLICIVLICAVSKPYWLGLVALAIAYVSGALTIAINVDFALLAFVALGIGAIASA
jgi:hypothetical protein